MLAAGLSLPSTGTSSPASGQSTPASDSTASPDATQAQNDPSSSSTAQAGANATPASTTGQPASSPTAAAALAQAFAAGQDAPAGQPAPAASGSQGSSAAATTTTPAATQAQATAAQAAANAAANATDAGSAATASQALPQSPLPGAGDPATPSGEGDGTKASTAGVKVSTTSSASSATSSNPSTGYAAQLVSQQAAQANSTPGNDQPPADGGFEGSAAAPVDGKPGTPDATKDTPAAANGSSDPKALQAAALPSVTDIGQAANAQAVASTQAAAATTSAATASAVIQQVTVHVSKAAVDGIDHINVQLNPPELGHVEVRMEIGPSGHFSAVFSADRPQTADMLQRNAHELTRSLQDAGVRTDAGSLSFNLRGQNQQGTPGWAGGFAGNAGRTSTPSWSNVPDEAPAPAAIYANSGVGTNRVDIRV